jgi:hypothetical protein
MDYIGIICLSGKGFLEEYRDKWMPCYKSNDGLKMKAGNSLLNIDPKYYDNDRYKCHFIPANGYVLEW